MTNVSQLRSTKTVSNTSAITAMKAEINTTHQTFLTSRSIDPLVATDYGIYSENAALVFPFIDGDNIVNRKFRGPQKKFWQDGGKQTLWNLQAIDEAIDGGTPLLICEGEMDALSAIQAGWTATVSVPAGAPKDKSEDFIDEEHDNKYSYIWDLQEKLDKVKSFILAGDNDKAGQSLNHELQRRLGVERCRFVKNDRKDLNDVLMQDSAEKLLQIIDEAPNYPVKGLYELNDFPDVGLPSVYSTGLKNMDYHMMLELGRLMVLTGVPGHGKSEVSDRIVFNVAMKYGWHSCVASFENAPTPNWRDSMRRKYWAADPYKLTIAQKKEADVWIQKHFSFIAQHPDEEHELSLGDIIEAATISVIRYGTKILLIDPWNEIEHKRRKDESDTEYVGRALRRLKSFARQYGVLVMVVAHPQKMNDKGNVKKPSLYDISGSANWFNKVDYGVLAWRPDYTKSLVEIDIKKIKFQHYMGKPAVVPYDFNVETGDYEFIGYEQHD